MMEAGMPSFSDSVFLFLLALLLFGPKRLPVLARELGKWIGEFRRASNEFKMQMDEELRASEQADRQKQIAAMEAAAPAQAPPEPEHPHLRSEPVAAAIASEPVETTPAEQAATEPLPIATSGSLNIMPPSTGLPTPRTRSSQASADPLGGLIESIPVATGADSEHAAHTESVEETAAHG